MPRYLSCPGMCNIRTWLDYKINSQSEISLHKIQLWDHKPSVGWVPVTCGGATTRLISVYISKQVKESWQKEPVIKYKLLSTSRQAKINYTRAWHLVVINGFVVLIRVLFYSSHSKSFCGRKKYFRVPIYTQESQWLLPAWHGIFIRPRYVEMQQKNTLNFHYNDGVLNHQPHHCLLNRLFRPRTKKTSKLLVTGLCVGNSPMTGEFPVQMTSNAANVSIWRRHHVVHEWSGCHCFKMSVIYCNSQIRILTYISN